MGVRRPFEGNIARMGLLMVVRDQLIAFGDTSAEVGRAKSGRALGGWGGGPQLEGGSMDVCGGSAFFR